MQPKLYSVEFLRIYAFYLVYRWHIARSNIDNNPLFIFFVLSGFVIAYRYYDRNEPLSLSGTLRFVWRRIARFYPTHLLVVMAVILLQAWYQRQGEFELGFGTPTEFLKKLLLSLTLTQSWAFTSQYHHCMNGVAWFISALVFFYLLTPLMLAGLRQLPYKAVPMLIIALCSVLYAKIPGWLGAYYYSTCPLLYLPLYTQGLALGILYVLLMRNRTFAQATIVRSCIAVVFVLYYIWQIYAPAQLRLPWLLPYGYVDIPILLLVFGLAQDVGPIRIFGNRIVQFFANRSMELYLSHQVWLLYVDAFRDVLLRRQIYWMTSDVREIFRLIGLFVVTEILHSVVPLVLTLCKEKFSLKNNRSNKTTVSLP